MSEAEHGLAGGQCLRVCGANASCPDGLRCTALIEGDATSRSCMRPCERTAECRQGRICQAVANSSNTFCVPHCQDDTDCKTTGYCNRSVGVCERTPTVPSVLAAVGAPCTTSSQCDSDFCIPESVDSRFAEGICVAFCSIERQGCPSGAACAIAYDDIGDLGICLQTCADDAECRRGFRCVPSSLAGGRRVCGPPR
jgi:hypothetical protein